MCADAVAKNGMAALNSKAAANTQSVQRATCLLERSRFVERAREGRITVRLLHGDGAGSLILAKCVVAVACAGAWRRAQDRDVGARCAAHVPRAGLCPPLLLYFATQRAPASRSITAGTTSCGRTTSGSGAGDWGALCSEVKEEARLKVGPGDLSGTGHPKRSQSQRKRRRQMPTRAGTHREVASRSA